MPLFASTLLREVGPDAKTFGRTRSEPAVRLGRDLAAPPTEWLHRSFPWDTYANRFLSIYTSRRLGGQKMGGAADGFFGVGSSRLW